MPEFLAVAGEGGDVVVVDTAPLGEVSDALSAAIHADGVLVVVRLGHTDRAALRRVRDLLGRVGRTPVGVVVIGADVRSLSYGLRRPASAVAAAGARATGAARGRRQSSSRSSARSSQA